MSARGDRAGTARSFQLPVDTETAEAQEYLDRTTAVNALRSRPIFTRSSLRLLSDLVDVLAVSCNGDGGYSISGKAPSATTLEYVAWASPTLFHMLPATRQQRWLPRAAWPPTQLVWVQRAADCKVSLAPLVDLLATSVAREFNDLAGVLQFTRDGAEKPAAQLWRWRRDRFRPWRVKDDESSAIATFRSDQDVIDRLWKEGRVYLQHLFVIAPELEQIPPDFEVQRYFHRILYVTTQTPSRVPAVLRRLLRPEVLARGMRNSHDVVPARLADLLDPDWRPPATFPDDAGPYFCSFIATRIRAGMSAARFDSQPADEEANIAQRERDAWPGWRIARDECRVPFHIDRLQSQWERWVKRGRRGAFADVAHRDDIQHAARWARAVTNRQVGVALSGGGASGYRLLPALKRFAQQGVPVDVVSGVSGGALIAAYYCAGGLPGLDRCIRTGRILQWILLPAAFSSDVFRWVVDRDLSAARIENLPVRLVAVATGLPDKGPPQGHVITRGTVGEAVQASGSAPLGFGPTDKATGSGPVRYTDGAFASMVPARILKDFGADYVFAFNCLAGPGKRNPLERYPLGQALYAYTPVGRLVDLWVSMAYLIEAASREAAEDAHVYYDPHDAEVPLVESFGFANAREIVRQAAACPRLRERVDACVAFWREVKERATEIPAPSSLGDPG